MLTAIPLVLGGAVVGGAELEALLTLLVGKLVLDAPAPVPQKNDDEEDEEEQDENEDKDVLPVPDGFVDVDEDPPLPLAVPVADRAVDGSVPLPEWNTPIVYPGKSLRYHIGFMNVDAANSPAGVPQLNITLNAMISLFNQTTNEVVYEIPSMRLGNMRRDKNAATRSFLWNGQRDAAHGQGDVPTGKYRIMAMIQDGRSLPHLSPFSPNKPYPSRWPVGFRRLTAADKRLHGVRVINNADGQRAPFLGGSPPYTALGAFEKDWKSFIGPAGLPIGGSDAIKTHDWHHIVEEKQPFSFDWIVSTQNLVRLEKRIHVEITEFYRQRQPRYQRINNMPVDEGLSLRAWLTKHYGSPTASDFNFQHDLGLRILRNDFHWTPDMQGDATT